MRAIVCTLTLLFSVQAQADPKKSTEKLLETFKLVTPEPEDGAKLDAAARKQNADAFGKLDTFFDYDTIVTQPIQKQKKKFSGAQLKKFKANFRALIRLIAYPDSGSFLERAQSEIKDVRTKGKESDVELHTYLEEEDLESTVTFHWKNKGKAWKVVDVSFDGASLSKDYENQFGRLIKKHGVPELIAKMEKRLKKENEERDLLP